MIRLKYTYVEGIMNDKNKIDQKTNESLIEKKNENKINEMQCVLKWK